MINLRQIGRNGGHRSRTASPAREIRESAEPKNVPAPKNVARASLAPKTWHSIPVAPPSAAGGNTDIAAVSRDASHMEVWWVAPDGSVSGSTWLDGAGWQPPYSVVPAGSASPEAGLAAVSRDVSHMAVWWITPAGAVYTSEWLDGEGWRQPYKVASEGSASPEAGLAAVTRDASHMEVWWVKTDGKLEGAWWTSAGWQAPYTVPLAQGASTKARIAALSRSSTHMEVWWIRGDGSVMGVWWAKGGPWQPPYSIAPAGNASIEGGLTSLSRNFFHMEVWWVGAKGTVEGAWWLDGKKWEPPYLVAPVQSASTRSAVAAVARDATHMEVLWVGAGRTVQAAEWTESDGWQDAYPVAPSQTASPEAGLAALSRDSSRMDVWWVGTKRSVHGAWWQDASAPSVPQTSTIPELFRFIQQDFVRPVAADAIDVTTQSVFQNALREKIDNGAEYPELREHAATLLVSGPVVLAGLSSSVPYVDAHAALSALRAPTTQGVRSTVEQVFGYTVEDLVSSAAFRADTDLASDLLVALKMTTKFDKVDVELISTVRRVIAFIVDFAAGTVKPFTAAEFSRRLSRPIKIPALFLPQPGSARSTEKDADRAADGAEDVDTPVDFYDDLQAAYTVLTSVRTSHLEIREREVVDRDGPINDDRAADADDGSEDAEVTGKTVVGVTDATFEALPRRARDIIATELDPAKAPLADIVDVVKGAWQSYARTVVPTRVPKPARVYAIGSQLFAVTEPRQVDTVDVAPAELDFSHAVTRPVGIGDLLVVRHELLGYEAGEISHIENALPGELFRRVTSRTETSELVLSEEIETAQSEERDVQTTQRSELASESQREAGQQSVATQDQTSTTNYGRLVENSKTNYARGVTDRAVNKVSQVVKRQRVQREQKVFSDKVHHELDNRGKPDVLHGVYQWVDKKYKAKVMNYGKRLLYDVVVPEPAAVLIEALKTAAQPENFQLYRPAPPNVSPDELDWSNYMYYAETYGVTGSVSPPPDEFYTTHAQTNADDVGVRKIKSYGGEHDAQWFGHFSIIVPEDYAAVSGYVQRSSVRYAGDAIDRVCQFFIGEDNCVVMEHGTINESFLMNDEVGQIPVTFRTYAKVLQFNYAVGINCRRTDKALEQWQLRTHATIVAGYERQREEYLERLGRYQAAVRAQQAAASALSRGASAERDELKRIFIQLLLAEHPTTYPPAPTPAQTATDPVYVKKWGSVVAFFERAFEWENMMYLYYPYLWGRVNRWGELIVIQDVDPQFQAFLKAGAARVVVPARPGFEAALAHYHETGDVWLGEEMPDMFSDMYVSIIAEIKARNAVPGDEVLVQEWEVRLPTTLVMARTDGQLPSWPVVPAISPV